MELYTADIPLKLKDFWKVFGSHIRDTVSCALRHNADDGYHMYAELPQIRQSYQKIRDIATIKGTIPTSDIVADMGLMELLNESLCGECGSKIQTVRYVTIYMKHREIPEI